MKPLFRVAFLFILGLALLATTPAARYSVDSADWDTLQVTAGQALRLPGACTAGANTYVVASTNQTFFVHTAGDAVPWSSAQTSYPSRASTCADPGSYSPSGKAAVFLARADGVVDIASDFVVFPRKVPSLCIERAALAGVDWNASAATQWYPHLNGAVVAYSCGNVTALVYYSFHAALHLSSNVVPALVAFDTSDTPGSSLGAVDVATFPQSGTCAAAFAYGSRAYFSRGTANCSSGSYAVSWETTLFRAAGTIVSLAVVAPDGLAYAVIEAGGLLTVSVLNVTTNATAELVATSSFRADSVTLAAGKLGDPENAAGGRDLLIHTGVNDTLISSAASESRQSYEIYLPPAAGQSVVALSSSTLPAHPYTNIVRLEKNASASRLDYFYGRETNCAAYSMQQQACPQKLCTYCPATALCVDSGEACPLCASITSQNVCSASLCSWCSETAECVARGTACQSCRHLSICRAPCVTCASNQVCMSRAAVCAHCGDYSANATLCLASPQCQYCPQTRECLAASSTCAACRNVTDSGRCSSLAGCEWCSYRGTCEGVYSGGGADRPTPCLCSGARTASLCAQSAAQACAWDSGRARCGPASCSAVPSSESFASTLLANSSGALVDVVPEASGGVAFALVELQAGPQFLRIAAGAAECTRQLGSGATVLAAAQHDAASGLVYVVGGGKNLPLSTALAPPDVAFQSFVMTGDCFLAAVNASDCSLVWAVPWGSSADGETFTDILLDGGRLFISGQVGPAFPVNGVCAPPAGTTGSLGLVLVYDRQWRLQDCSFCGTSVTQMSALDGRLVAVGGDGAAAVLLRFAGESWAWSCDSQEANDSGTVALLRDETSDYLIALVSSAWLRVLEFDSSALLYRGPLGAPNVTVAGSARNADASLFAAVDLAGYVTDGAAREHPWLATLSLARFPNSSSLAVASFAQTALATSAAGRAGLTGRPRKSAGKFFGGGASTSPDFLSTTGVARAPDQAPLPFFFALRQADRDTYCLPPFPIPSRSLLAEPLAGCNKSRDVYWPVFELSWAPAYFGFANSYYLLLVGVGGSGAAVPPAALPWTAVSHVTSLPVAFRKVNVSWTVRACAPHSCVESNSSFEYEVAPLPWPADMADYAARRPDRVAAAAFDDAGSPLPLAGGASGLTVKTYAAGARISLAFESCMFNATGGDWLTFSVNASGGMGERRFAPGYPKVTLVAYDGANETWSANSSGCYREQLRGTLLFGVPLASPAPPGASGCTWTSARSAPAGLDLRGIAGLVFSFAFANPIGWLSLAQVGVAADFAPPYAPSRRSGAALPLLSLAALPLVAAAGGAAAAAFLRRRAAGRGGGGPPFPPGGRPAAPRRRRDESSGASAELAEVRSSAAAVGGAAIWCDLGGSLLLATSDTSPITVVDPAPLNFGYSTAPLPVNERLTDRIVLRNNSRALSAEVTAKRQRQTSRPPDESAGKPAERGAAETNGSQATSKASSDPWSYKSEDVMDIVRATFFEYMTETMRRSKSTPFKIAWKIYGPPASHVYDLKFEPDAGTLDPDKTAAVNISLLVTCTKTLKLKIPIGMCLGSTFTRPQVHFMLSLDVETDLSTRLDVDDFAREEPAIGHGTFGVVYKATWRGQVVAVKMLKNQEAFDDELDAFRMEVKTMETLKSPYIVSFVGFCWIPKKYAIVTEFCPYGDLDTILEQDACGPEFKLKCLLDCARGMHAIHMASLIHRDLKPSNLLVVSLDPSALVCAKVADLGTARRVNRRQATQYYTARTGTPSYMAPEIIKKAKYSPAADVYSFALVAYRVWSGLEPYARTEDKLSESYQEMWNIEAFVTDGKRLSLPPAIPAYMAELIRECWAQDPHQRPSFERVAEILETRYRPILEEYQLKTGRNVVLPLRRDADGRGSAPSRQFSSKKEPGGNKCDRPHRHRHRHKKAGNSHSTPRHHHYHSTGAHTEKEAGGGENPQP
jgi:serine/threonine protein kinase